MTISAQTFVSVLVFFLVVHVVLLTCAYLIYVERKMAAYIQDRIGPNRVGFDFGLPILGFLKGCLGLGQSLADGLKFLLKEDYAPDRVDKRLFTLAPIAIIIPALIGFAIIPWGGTATIPSFSIFGLVHITGGEVVLAGLNANIGIVYLLAVASLGVYGVTLGGWASNNKYSFLGGLRATAQMISYEIPLGLSLLAILLVYGTLMPEEIIAPPDRQNGWMV
jgi:NADH-quinone oxidoreductase subunit H